LVEQLADFFVHRFETTYFEPKALAKKQATRIKQVDWGLRHTQLAF
jgi:hypothetical protein